ncbi:hypothetical protein RFI_05847, partial [Reticulomyxa filosa]
EEEKEKKTKKRRRNNNSIDSKEETNRKYDSTSDDDSDDDNSDDDSKYNKDDNKKKHSHTFISSSSSSSSSSSDQTISRNILSVLRMSCIEFQWIVSQQRMNLLIFFIIYYYFWINIYICTYIYIKQKKKGKSMALLIGICYKQNEEWLSQYFPFFLDLLAPTPLDIRLTLIRKHCYTKVQEIDSEKKAKVLLETNVCVSFIDNHTVITCYV